MITNKENIKKFYYYLTPKHRIDKVIDRDNHKYNDEDFIDYRLLFKTFEEISMLFNIVKIEDEISTAVQ